MFRKLSFCENLATNAFAAIRSWLHPYVTLNVTLWYDETWQKKFTTETFTTELRYLPTERVFSSLVVGGQGHGLGNYIFAALSGQSENEKNSN